MVEIHIEKPLMSVKEYADLMCVTPNAIRMKIKRGQLPIYKAEKNSRPMVNLALLAKQAAEAEK